MSIEYKELTKQVKGSSPHVVNSRITYYKINDVIIFEYYNSGSVEKPYHKVFFNDDIWFKLKFDYDYDVQGVIKLLKKVIFDVLKIKVSSLGRKQQDGDYLFHI